MSAAKQQPLPASNAETLEAWTAHCSNGAAPDRNLSSAVSARRNRSWWQRLSVAWRESPLAQSGAASKRANAKSNTLQVG
jgi:hypothetical protein